MNRLLCYAHFDEQGRIKPFVKHALSTMAPLCSTMVFVSNSPLAEDDLADLRARCAHVLVNENTGFDFYMWKLALQAVNYATFDEVVLMNSSVYGPLFPVDGIFAEMGSRDCDFWGITECFQIQPHCQSYFLVFEKKLISSNQFKLFWNDILPYTNKSQVIRSYEVGLSQWFVESGFKPAVYFGFDELGLYCRSIGKRLRKKDNTSISHAAELLQIGSPFLKLDAVRKGIAGRIDVSLQPAARSYPLDYIDELVTWKKEIGCPLCGALGKAVHKGVRDYLNMHIIRRYDYYRCGRSRCGVLWQFPPLAEEDTRILYRNIATPSGDPAQENAGEFWRQSRHSRLASLLEGIFKLSRLPRLREKQRLKGLKGVIPGRILVVGCCNADLLSTLHGLGWEVTGFETDARVLERLRQQNGNIRYGILETGDMESNRFDHVMLVNALEHTCDPRRLIAECFRLLKPGGSLQLVTANVAAISRFLFGKYWFGLNAPRHRMIHSRGSLRGLLSSAGFHSIQVRTSALNEEMYAMHSIDIAFNRWTSLLRTHRIGKEFGPLLLQFAIGTVNLFMRVLGSECHSFARK